MYAVNVPFHPLSHKQVPAVQFPRREQSSSLRQVGLVGADAVIGSCCISGWLSSECNAAGRAPQKYRAGSVRGRYETLGHCNGFELGHGHSRHQEGEEENNSPLQRVVDHDA